MAKFSPESIRTIALTGHGGSGKTTLAETLLGKAGAIATMGTVEKGTTVCDFDPLEKQFQHSLNASVVHLQHRDTRIHVIDTPGLPDFIGRANLIPGKVASLEGPHAVIETDIGAIVGLNPQRIDPGKEAVLCVRPEFIRTAVTGAMEDRNLFRGKIETLLFIGEAYEGEIRIGETLVTTTISPTVDLAEGGDIRIAFDPDHCFLLPA